MESLLASVGELPAPESRGGHWGRRVRTRLEEGLLLLRDRGVIREVAWPQGFEPGEAERTKGWVARWLPGKLRIRGVAVSPPDR